MKLFRLAGVLAVAGAFVSCGEREEVSSVPVDQNPPPPKRDAVKIETHDARPKERLKIIPSSNKAIINWNEFSLSDDEIAIVTPGPDSKTLMKVPGKLSDYERLPVVSGGGRVTIVDEEGNSVEAKPAPEP